MSEDESVILRRSQRIARVLMMWSALGLFLLGLLLLFLPLRTQAASRPFPLPGEAADNGGAISHSNAHVAHPGLIGRAVRGSSACASD